MSPISATRSTGRSAGLHCARCAGRATDFVMTRIADLSIRARVTTAFAVVMAVLLAGLAAVLYVSIGSALLDEIDTGLRFRAASLMSVPQADVTERRQASLEEPDESFDQLVSVDGTVLRNTPGLARGP